MSNSIFQFKQFNVHQDINQMKVGTDGILLGAWVNCEAKKSILDIGTGTGLLALMVAQKNSKCAVDGVEIDEGACEEAIQNIKESSFGDRINIHKGSIQDYAKDADKKYDLIVCNPPFFTGGTLSNNMGRQAVRHTTKLSHTDLLRSVASMLQPNGHFALIVPFLEGLRFVEMAESYKLHLKHKTKVRSKASSKIERLLLSFCNCDTDAMVEDEIIIYNEDGGNTAAYKQLTKDFYLNELK